MNYIKQLNTFRSYKLSNGLPTTAQIIYYNLLEINNELGWGEWFGATNARMMSDCSISNEKTFIRNRNHLKQIGLIEFESGKKHQPTRYKIIQLYQDEIDWQIASESDSENDRVNDRVNDSESDPKTTDINKHINKTKVKVRYAEFVSLTKEEYEKLIDKFGEVGAQDRIDTLNLYKGSKGKKYASDYLTILKWAKNEEKKNNKKESWEWD